jgi:hypothetical protein
MNHKRRGAQLWMPKRYCAKNPPTGSAGLKVGMRSEGEAEIAIEQEKPGRKASPGPPAAKSRPIG